jgi:hypothetical protein
MLYPDGEEARIGDRIELGNGFKATVVCSIDTNEYSSEYPRSSWDYLGVGILVLSDKAGLIYYDVPEPTMKLLHRASIS